MFGHRINFNVNGEESHRTIWGACVTILILLQLCQVLVYLVVDIVIFDKDRLVTTILYPNYYGETNQPLQQKAGWKFAVGLSSVTGFQEGQSITEFQNYAKWTAEYVVTGGPDDGLVFPLEM